MINGKEETRGDAFAGDMLVAQDATLNLSSTLTTKLNKWLNCKFDILEGCSCLLTDSVK